MGRNFILASILLLSFGGSLNVWSFATRSLSFHQNSHPIVGNNEVSTEMSLLRAGTLFHRTILHASRRHNPNNRHDDDDDDDDNVLGGGEPSIPQLPAIGASSFASLPSSSSSCNDGDGKSMASVVVGNVVSPKFELQYTCNVCDTRNKNMVSRIAYREGVVVAICKGCKSKHLIADNLGTTGSYGEGRNIEEFQGVKDSVTRVGKDVFQLDSLWHLDTSGGSLVGENGKPVLE